MWPKLIELVVKWWQAKPRNDLIAGIVELRDAMTECHGRYEIFQRERADDHAKWRWIGALGRVARALQEFDRILVIFGPEAREAMRDYVRADSLELFAEGTFLGTSMMLETDDTGVDFRTDTLSESFDLALSELDRFIRSTFKPEEIHAARESKHGPDYLKRLGL